MITVKRKRSSGPPEGCALCDRKDDPIIDKAPLYFLTLIWKADRTPSTVVVCEHCLRDLKGYLQMMFGVR